jgi:pilus assembly protein CpaC
MKKANRLASLLVALGVQVCLSVAALAAQTPQISIEVSEGRLLTLSGPATSVFLADPAIADVQVPQPNKVFIFGKKTGHTTLHALGDNGQQIASYDIYVTHPSPRSEQMAATAAAGGGDVKVTAQDSGTILKGDAADPETAASITTAVKSTGPAGAVVDTNGLNVEGSTQVMLRVWIGEVDRSVTKNLGFNWQAFVAPGSGLISFYTGRQLFNTNAAGTPTSFILPTSSFGSVGAQITTKTLSGGTFVDALASEGLITTLAEPTLMAMSGESASFLAGGQFPIPIVQPGTGTNSISVEFQQYGVSLTFTPTVLAPNRISLKVRPEVSEISTVAEVNFDGYVIPSLTIRRASTTVELGSGQSFAIGGLIQNTTSSTVQRYPGLGDLPVLGTLFRSTNFQHDESELIFIVTPYLVKPIDDPNRLKLPTDGISTPNDLERIFRGRIAIGTSAEASPNATAAPPSSVSVLTGPRLAGDAGFDLE